MEFRPVQTDAAHRLDRDTTEFSVAAERARAAPPVKMEPRGRTSHFFSLALAGAALAQISCSVIVEPNRQQCTVDADCQARGAAFAGSLCVDTVCTPDPDPAWSCLKSVSWPPPTVAQVTVTVKFRDIVTNAP